MIIIMEPKATVEQINVVKKYMENKGFKIVLNHGDVMTVLAAIGDKRLIEPQSVASFEGVREVKLIQEPYKLASRESKEEDTVIEFRNGVKVGGLEKPVMMVGPCSVEKDFDWLMEVANAAKEMGCEFLRGGAFKPRTSPYAFQGLGEEGLKIIKKVADKYGMAVTSEIMEISQIPVCLKYVDILQVGARNMQNFNLLRELGHINKPVIIKRGLANTIEELLMAAEYVMSGGNRNVILCERGIRTFERITRNTLDLSAIPVVKKLSHLPIIIDPSHGTGLRDKVAPMSRAAVAAGCDGLIVEVHNEPESALCDGAQSLYPEQFKALKSDLEKIAPIVGKKIL